MGFSIPQFVEFYGKRFQIMEEVDNKFLRACLAEFLAMHLFVLLCCGCAMVTFNLSNPNLMMIAASFGFGILVLAQIFGPLSGGHINNAVSFGLFIAGRISFLKCLCYTLSQMLGSVFGALFLWAIFGTHWPAARAFGSNSWDEGVFTGGQVFFAEMLGTMLLLFNVLSTIDIPKEGGGPLGVYPIAMSVMVAHLFLLPASQSMTAVSGISVKKSLEIYNRRAISAIMDEVINMLDYRAGQYVRQVYLTYDQKKNILRSFIILRQKNL